jgi:glycosyltransferase involved in cell wall biosynthesis
MGRWKKPHQVALDRLLARWTDAIICCSDYQREVAGAQEHFPAGRAVTIHHGVDIGRFPARVDRTSLRASLGLRPGWTTVGTVGRTVKEKGHATLLDAVPQILRAHPRVQFLIVGDGPLRQALEARLAGTPHREHVCFAGARPDIPEMMAAMDLFAFPSVSEGFGIALVEAMASSIPVVASRIRPLTEIVVDGQTGRLVPAGDAAALADALNQLIANPDLARSLGRRARLAVEDHFTDRLMVRAHEDLYWKLHQAAVARGKGDSTLVNVSQ